MKNLVFTEQSILAFADSITKEKIESQNFEDSTKYILVESDDSCFFLTTHRKDSQVENVPFIIFEQDVNLTDETADSIQDALYIVHRTVSQILQRQGTAFALPSIIYHSGNKLSLKTFGNKRLFLSIKTAKTNNFQVFKKASNKDDLEEFSPNVNLCEKCNSFRAELKKRYEQEIDKREIEAFDRNYNLKTVFEDDKQAAFTYIDWQNKLSAPQKAFFESDCSKALKLTGPAGTGKTLVMELKLIKILKSQPDARILFTCHSWSVACQVSDFIDSIAPELSNRVDIFPLLELAKSHISLKNKDIAILGNDSFDGKYKQISILSEIIQDFLKTDWVLYRTYCSDEFVQEIEDVTEISNNFTWDLMIEFACVIGANGIFPTKNANEKYKAIDRRNWMLHLENDTEKDVVFFLYERYTKKLISKKIITSDQITNDYINYLSTYNWYYDRVSEGYDYIFVDEMQLFNDQERICLTYLSRDAGEYPKLIMALDPKQSVDEIYSDLGVSSISSKHNPETEKSMGTPSSFSLDIAYRYTRQILNFLKHIDASYPQMDLGHEWNNNIASLKDTKAKAGDVPQLYTYNSATEEVSKAISLADKFATEGKQTAILSLQDDLFRILQQQIKNNPKCREIRSKREVDLLKYTKKKILISQPNYVIGLQFDAVILIGCYSIYKKYEKNKSYYQRRFLSDLYLGASRAKKILILSRNNSLEDSFDFIDSAISNGCIEEKDSTHTTL